MKNEVLISVIVPLYNKEAWIERCILSIIHQTYQNIEILIINDGSTDDSRNVVKAIHDKRIKIFDKQNGGVSTARNYGIEKAKGEYIALIDADDEWELRHLEVMLAGFKKTDNVVLVCDDLIETMDGIKENTQKRSLPFNLSLTNNNSILYFKIEDYISTLKDGYFILSASSVLIKSSIIKEHQLKFHEHLSHGEDINYWLQLYQLGDFIFSNYRGLLYHRDDKSSAMNQSHQVAQLVAKCFYNINIDKYSKKEKINIKKFLSHEYYKKAFQNRGLTLRKEELSTYIGCGVQIGRWNILPYLLIRYCPQSIFSLHKKIRKS